MRGANISFPAFGFIEVKLKFSMRQKDQVKFSFKSKHRACPICTSTSCVRKTKPAQAELFIFLKKDN